VGFVGGLTANLLIREPLGSLPLALLLGAAAVAGGERLFGRLTWGYPLASVAIGSVVVDVVSLAILQMVDLPLAGSFPMQRIIAAALLNAAIARSSSCRGSWRAPALPRRRRGER
jgi:hypothetical protein